jgi:hypothetical protein
MKTQLFSLPFLKAASNLRLTRKWLILASIALSILWGSRAQALTYTVNTTSDDLVTGACANNTAGCSLSGAITEAEANLGADDIVFDIPDTDLGCVEGVCTIQLLTQLPDITEAVTISGPGPEYLIVRRSIVAFRIFRSSSVGPVSLSNFTISGGFKFDQSGGGILNAGVGTMTIDNCVVSDNSVGRSDSTHFVHGGGIANTGGGQIDIFSSTITGNTAEGDGGGIYNTNQGNVTLRNTTLSNNTTATDDYFVGGAIYNASGTVNVTNSTLANNSASGLGGAIFNTDIMGITNCTISGNAAVQSETSGHSQAGGICNFADPAIYSPAGASSLIIKSSLVAQNTAAEGAQDVLGPFISLGFNLIGESDGSTGFDSPTDLTGTSAAPLDPLLDPNGLQDNGGPTQTIALRFGSPAIDQGTSESFTNVPTDVLATDQRGSGFPRTFDDPAIPNAAGGEGTDIGAFEVQTAGPTSTILGNISTRLLVETGDNVLIGGFILTGTQAKKVIVRAIGPSLPLAGVLGDPTLELHDGSGTLIASNDNWMNAPNKQEIIDSTIAPTNDMEAAILMSLDPGAYTAIVSGVNNRTGIGLVEAYDLDTTADSKLANISTRGLVQTGDNVMIGGFIILGNDPPKVIVRAIGPSLPVTGKLADPVLELHNPDGSILASNDNWRSTQESEIMDTGIPPTNDLESAIVATLPPAAYTAVVRGKNNGTGVGLVEVYRLQQ